MEIYNTHNLLLNKNPIKTFHLAEGPGGFIESTAYIRNNKLDKYNAITLLDKNGKCSRLEKSRTYYKKIW